MNQAREVLRRPDLMPQFIREEQDAERRAVNQQFGKAIADLEHRIRMIDQLEKIQADDQRAVLHAETSAPHLLSVQEGRPKSIRGEVWAAYVKERVAERPGLIDQLGRTKAEADSLRCRAAAKLGYYVDRIA